MKHRHIRRYLDNTMGISPFSLYSMLLLMSLYARDVDGTFTIAAADNATNQVGGAGSTCIEEDGFSLYKASYQSVPGKSVLHAQGLLHTNESFSVLRLALELMANDTLPEVVLQTVASSQIDSGSFEVDETTSFPVYQLRQYGLVDLSGNPAGYTNVELDAVYELFGFQPSSQTDEQGTFESFSFAAQGNVVSEPTVPLLTSAFQEGNACDLAQRLMNAVSAVHEAGEGDRRCANGVGSVAFLHVENANGQEVVHIDVAFEDRDDFDPFASLKESFEEWREMNPCRDDVSGDNSTANTTQDSMPEEDPPTKNPSSSTFSSDLLFSLASAMSMVSLVGVWF